MASAPCTRRKLVGCSLAPLSVTTRSSGFRSVTGLPFLSRAMKSSTTSSTVDLTTGVGDAPLEAAGCWAGTGKPPIAANAARVSEYMQSFMAVYPKIRLLLSLRQLGLSCRLLRIPLPGAHNTNLVVGELVVGPGQFDLRHVAGGAIVFGDRAILLPPVVTCLAFSVVMGGSRHNFFVWIVTRRAADALVVRVVALAVSHPVGLEAHVGDAVRTVRRNVPPGAMAASAEFVGFFRGHAGEMRHGRAFRVARLHRCHVMQCLRMTVFAPHSGFEILGVEHGAPNRARRVTRKTFRHLLVYHFPARRLDQVLGLERRDAVREVEAVDRRKKADAALVENALPLVHIGLADCTQPEGPPDRHADGVGSVRDAVNAPVASARDGVGIAPVLKGQLRAVAQDVTVLHPLQRMTHGRERLAPSFGFMAGSAGDGGSRPRIKALRENYSAEDDSCDRRRAHTKRLFPRYRIHG